VAAELGVSGGDKSAAASRYLPKCLRLRDFRNTVRGSPAKKDGPAGPS
jgi:hypothetical protein